MNSLQIKALTIAATITLIVGCDGSNLASNNPITKLIDKTVAVWPIVSDLTNEVGSNKIGSKEIDTPLSKPKFPDASINHRQLAASAIANLNQRRRSCGFGELQVNDELNTMSEQHAKYIQHVFVQADRMPNAYTPHSEKRIAGFTEVTGERNPYFAGEDLLARVQAAQYQYRDNIVGESINTRLIYESAGVGKLNPQKVTSEMLSSLLAAPYHLATLMSPNFNQNGTSIISFVPNNKAHTKARGFVLVTTNGADSKLPPPNKLLTYPCAGSTNTARMLDNESPNPMQGLGRNLRSDPVGQPIYITYPAAKRIKVSDISFVDAGTNEQVPTYLLDTQSDPHQRTAAELPANSAFIIPLTDGFKNCDAKVRSAHNNCGLHPNTTYRASFTVQIDNVKTLQRSVEFTTGS